MQGLHERSQCPAAASNQESIATSDAKDSVTESGTETSRGLAEEELR